MSVHYPYGVCWTCKEPLSEAEYLDYQLGGFRFCSTHITQAKLKGADFWHRLRVAICPWEFDGGRHNL